MKIPKTVKRDFDFFLGTDLDLIGASDFDALKIKKMSSAGGRTALECWHLKDTFGKLESCREPSALNKALRGKKSWNLQIKEWATDLADSPILILPELENYTKDCPAWVLKATMKQAQRIATQNIGFVPLFLKTKEPQ